MVDILIVVLLWEGSSVAGERGAGCSRGVGCQIRGAREAGAWAAVGGGWSGVQVQAIEAGEQSGG